MPLLSARRTTAAAALAVAVLLPLAGCSAPATAPAAGASGAPAASGATSGGVPASAGTSSPGTAASPSASASVKLPPAAKLPAGHRWITTAAHGVRFAVPSAWSMFDLSTFTDPAVRAALAPVAKKLGLSTDEYVRQLTMQNDAIVTGPDRSGFSPTISVRKEAAEQSSYVPSVAEAQQVVAPAGGTVTAVNPLVTTTGQGYAILYTRRAEDGKSTRYCASLGLASVKDTTFLTIVETDSAAERDSLVKGVTSTLQHA